MPSQEFSFSIRMAKKKQPDVWLLEKCLLLVQGESL